MSRETPPLYVHRARRFALSLSVSYRRPSDGVWIEGTSIDISRTGVLFTAAPPAPAVGERIEFRVRLPAIRGPCGSEALCTGRVLRVIPGSSERAEVALAVAIDRYRLVPASQLQEGREPSGNRAPRADTKER